MSAQNTSAGGDDPSALTLNEQNLSLQPKHKGFSSLNSNDNSLGPPLENVGSERDSMSDENNDENKDASGDGITGNTTTATNTGDGNKGTIATAKPTTNELKVRNQRPRAELDNGNYSLAIMGSFTRQYRGRESGVQVLGATADKYVGVNMSLPDNGEPEVTEYSYWYGGSSVTDAEQVRNTGLELTEAEKAKAVEISNAIRNVIPTTAVEASQSEVIPEKKMFEWIEHHYTSNTMPPQVRTLHAAVPKIKTSNISQAAFQMYIEYTLKDKKMITGHGHLQYIGVKVASGFDRRRIEKFTIKDNNIALDYGSNEVLTKLITDFTGVTVTVNETPSGVANLEGGKSTRKKRKNSRKKGGVKKPVSHKKRKSGASKKKRSHPKKK